MASQNAKIDSNNRKTLLGVTDDAAAELRRLLVDPATGRLKTTAVIADGTSIQKINVDLEGVLVGTRKEVNFIQGTNMTITVTDNALNDRVDIELVSSGGAGGGDVTGPASSTDNAVVRFNGITGKAIQNSGVIIDDSNNVTGVVGLTATTVTVTSVAASSFVTLEETGAGTDTIKLQAPASIAASYTLTLPVDDGTANQVLTTNGSGVLSWSSNGAGDVVGPASATDNAIARYDGTTGKLIQNSGATIDDSGNITATNFTGSTSGTNTGDQTITLTGDVTGAGTGTFATTIANDAVTYAKMQNVSATDKVLGRSSVGAGDVQEITMTAAGRSLMDDATVADMRTTLGLGTIATQNSNNVTITGGSITNITDLTVPDGGTGASTFTDGGVLIGNGTGAIQATAVGNDGQVLTSNGAGSDPTFQDISTLLGANSGFHVTAVTTADKVTSVASTGYDDETGTITIGGYAPSNSQQAYSRYQVATDFGISLYRVGTSTTTSTLNTPNVLYADGHYWAAETFDAAGTPEIAQDGTTMSFGSNDCSGAMAWDNGNNYFLINNTTTNVRRFTYSGTTFTFVDNITLSNAVSTNMGFVFDDVSNEYYFLDTTNNVIRNFNSSGTQLGTTAYTIDDAGAIGLVVISGRIYIAVSSGVAAANAGINAISVDFVPTTVTV